MTTLSNEALAKEMLPCPFCGGRAELVTKEFIAPSVPNFGVICYHDEKCPLVLTFDQIPMHFSDAEAITAWNTRTPPVREDVLEEAAKVAEDQEVVAPFAVADMTPGQACEHGISTAALSIAARIRALKTTPPEPADEGKGKWDHRYRRLEMGEVILATDDVQNDDGSWRRAMHAIGQEAPDPCYTSHRVYRRLKATPENSELVTQAGDVERVARAMDPTLFGTTDERAGPTTRSKREKLREYARAAIATLRIEATREAQATPAGEVGELADVSASGPINGMCEADQGGSYVCLAVGAKDAVQPFKISAGAAECLAYELVGSIAKPSLRDRFAANACGWGDVSETDEQIALAVRWYRRRGSRGELMARIDELEQAADTITSLQATVSRLEAEQSELIAELRLWRSLVNEGGVPRYTITPGAALNTVVTGTDGLLARAALEPTTKYGRGSTGPENGGDDAKPRH